MLDTYFEHIQGIATANYYVCALIIIVSALTIIFCELLKFLKDVRLKKLELQQSENEIKELKKVLDLLNR